MQYEWEEGGGGIYVVLREVGSTQEVLLQGQDAVIFRQEINRARTSESSNWFKKSGLKPFTLEQQVISCYLM